MKTIKNIALIVILMAGLGISNLYGQSSDSPKLYAVLFSADYCSACKAIAPKVMALQDKLDAEDVKFVKFDFSNNESKDKNKEIAKKLGLNDVLASNNGTGYVVLVDAKSKDEKAVLTTKQSTEEMLALVEKNLIP